jgi:predicted RecB family nuclease
MSNLSKSKILAHRQCPRRLWLELHEPELRDDPDSETVFQFGHQVGAAARSLYDPAGNGVSIDVRELGHPAALALSAELLAAGQAPVFEAGVAADGGLAYADVMVPDLRDGSLSWHMIEVKAATSLKDHYHDEIAVQAHLATSAGVKLASVKVAHIDSSFVYPGGGDYRGLLVEHDLTKAALARSGEVREWIASARLTADLPDEPVTATGPHCTTPYACGFSTYCNRDQVQAEYPLSFLPKIRRTKRLWLEEQGFGDLRSVPDGHLSGIQARVKQHTAAGTVFFDTVGAAIDLAPYGFPAYFLDFETVQSAVPVWPGTRPYQQIPFQFSLHVLTAKGALIHHSFLDLSGDDPSRHCAELLIARCGLDGPVFAYHSPFECRVMRDLAERFPDLAADLEAIVDRVVDLLPIARNRYYHPSQQGSWSLKAVLPAAVPDLSYDALDGVANGGQAVAAYQEAIQPATSPGRKTQLEAQLHAYCNLDTLALVRLWKLFSGAHAMKLEN